MQARVTTARTTRSGVHHRCRQTACAPTGPPIKPLAAAAAESSRLGRTYGHSSSTVVPTGCDSDRSVTGGSCQPARWDREGAPWRASASAPGDAPPPPEGAGELVVGDGVGVGVGVEVGVGVGDGELGALDDGLL